MLGSLLADTNRQLEASPSLMAVIAGFLSFLDGTVGRGWGSSD